MQIVEKILAHRIRKRRKKKKNLEKIVELKEEKTSVLDSDNKSSNVADNGKGVFKVTFSRLAYKLLFK